MGLRTILAIFLLQASMAIAESTDRVIQFGSVAMDIPAVMRQRLAPLTSYLSEKLHMPVRIKTAKNMNEAVKNIVDGTVDLAYLTPVAYLNAQKEGQVQLVVKTITHGSASFKLMIVVRNDSPIKEIGELRGKSFAFGDPAAHLQQAVVKIAGLSLSDFERYKYLGHYDNIVRAVMHGEFEGGILKDTTAYKWQNNGVRIVYSSEDLPPYNICASRKMDAATLEQIKKALLELDPKNPQHNPVIKALDPNYDGFAITEDKEYDAVRRLIAALDNNH